MSHSLLRTLTNVNWHNFGPRSTLFLLLILACHTLLNLKSLVTKWNLSCYVFERTHALWYDTRKLAPKLVRALPPNQILKTCWTVIAVCFCAAVFFHYCCCCLFKSGFLLSYCVLFFVEFLFSVLFVLSIIGLFFLKTVIYCCFFFLL